MSANPPIPPYKVHPKPPVICLLLETGEILSETGANIDLDDMPSGHNIFCSYDTVRTLVSEGKGEALCWNREEIRWRHRSFDDPEGWKKRASDVSVLKTPFPSDPNKCLRSLMDWRDWLSRYHAAPIGTTGSAAWSLLRSSIRSNIWTNVGDVPPLSQTLGGRQNLGANGAGRFRGNIVQLDLPAAYASELGNLKYGGRWYAASDYPGVPHGPEWWSEGGRPVFVKASIRIPDLPFGPLPSRPRGYTQGLKALLLGATYPTNCDLEGLWTWEEVLQAITHGCKILKLHEIWGHISGSKQPFLKWWNAIIDGRRMPGLAGQLAKMTGNALWGRFCMDSTYGRRSIASKKDKDSPYTRRELSFGGGLKPDHGLAETVSGRIRAKLFAMMMFAGDRLLSAHTDGVWTFSLGKTSPEEWRRKGRAIQIDLLDPQVLRYWPDRKLQPVAVFAGVPAGRSLATFEKAWKWSGYV